VNSKAEAENNSKALYNQFVTVLDPHFHIKKKKKIDFDSTVYDVCFSLLSLSPVTFGIGTPLNS